jgi:hypothetical protein
VNRDAQNGRSARARCWTVALLAALAGAGCGKQIGDNCQTASDCNPNGGRICDLSQPGGYCTVLGCDETTCPSEATCIRYFPSAFLTKPCNPYCEDRQGLTAIPDGGTTDAGSAVPPPCPAKFPPTPGSTSPVCPSGPTNDCTADEICLDSGLCAPRSTEIRYCAKVCSSNDDCRSGYVCRPTGTAGSFELSSVSCRQTAFCSPM